MADDSWGFAPPPFKPDTGLQKLARELRGLGLIERAGQFERRGTAIARAKADGAVIAAARVKRPSRSSPEWQSKTIKHDADLRDFVADLKMCLAAWSDTDD